MQTKKVLITGGAGFIGSHLCEYYVEKGFDVYSLDNYFTGSTKNHVEGVTYINGCTTQIDELITFTPMILYHLGEYSRVEQSFEDIDLVYKSNIKGTFKVLEFVRKHKCKLIYAGSSTKYGEDGLGKNASPYAFSKASNTELVKNYGSWFGIEYAITYFYNVYGGREINEGKYATVVGSFLNMYKNNKDLTVVSPGTQIRNFTHIDDIINALVLIGTHGQGDEYGIGSDKSFSIIEVANMISNKIKILPPREGNRMSSKVITDKTKKLGWKPTKSLEEYIKENK